MDSATRNAKDMVDRLTLYMNKVRQAAITREIIEVVVGRAGGIDCRSRPEACRAGAQRSERESYGDSNRAERRQGHPGHRPRRRRRVRGRLPARHLQRPPHRRRRARPATKVDIVAEVEQHLGENRVRAVAMKPTDGMQRGMDGDRHRRADLGAGRPGDARPRAERARRAGRLPGSAGGVEGALADSPPAPRRSSSSRPS